MRRGPALLALAMLAIVLLLACWQPDTAPAPKLRTNPNQPSDLKLYKDIIAGVAAGGNYYEVAAEAQRASNYPLKPFTTFRLPTLASLFATFGEAPMRFLFWLLSGGMLFAWWRRLEKLMPPIQAGIGVAFIGGGIGGLIQPGTIIFHESWAAILIALMIGIYRPEKPLPAMIVGAAALMIRELALPMIGLMMVWALIGKRWKEAVGWAAIIAIFFLYLAFHAHMVSQVVLPTDKPSPGWNGLNGFQFALKSMAKVTMGIRMPAMLASGLLVLSLFGWLSVRHGWALVTAVMLIGYGTLLAVFARADTFYWALIVAPLAFAGLAFVPKAFRDLALAIRGVPKQTA